MFAVVDIAGFQETVSVGGKLRVPSLEGDAGKTMTFDKVLMVSDGDKLTLGSPLVSGASIEAKVLAHGRGEKIRVTKMRRRKRYRRVHGHKQGYTELEVTKINA